ncbi:MAG TPA: FAD binding domain-containing protein, partial [Anaerolineales bacterium]|nr:FAD binding domain-containing protein [Anaerolineales bacterium]
MILEYHRPEKMKEALALLARETPRTVPLGGGTVLNAPSEKDYAVVDLQGLGLDSLDQKGSQLQIGAAATLQALLAFEGIQPALAETIRLTVNYNLRQTGTVAGALVSGGGRSPFLAAMLALDANLMWQPDNVEQNLGSFIHLRGGEWPGALISTVQISLQTKLAYTYVARSPADRPVVCAAVGRWP